MNEHVELTIPARAEFLSLVRLSVGAAATRLNMTIDEIDDLQLAVEELCITLFTSADDGARLTTTMTATDDVVDVECRLTGGTGVPVVGAALLPDSLSRKILDALVDEHTLGVDGGVPVASLRKRRQRDVTPL